MGAYPQLWQIMRGGYTSPLNRDLHPQTQPRGIGSSKRVALALKFLIVLFAFFTCQLPNSYQKVLSFINGAGLEPKFPEKHNLINSSVTEISGFGCINSQTLFYFYVYFILFKETGQTVQ